MGEARGRGPRAAGGCETVAAATAAVGGRLHALARATAAMAMASASAGAAGGAGNVQHVLVYAGEGVGSGPLRQTLQALRSLLSHRYDVKPVEAHALAEQPWPETTALLVLPGGRDLPFVQRLSGKGTPLFFARGCLYNGGPHTAQACSPARTGGRFSAACARIRKFVEGGGAYLGLCAGAYFGCRHIEFERGTPLEVGGARTSDDVTTRDPKP